MKNSKSNFGILYRDELRGFFHSRVMLVLWIGLPLVSLFFQLLQPDVDGMPLLTFTALMIGSIGGTLSSVLMATTITGERVNKIYDLFLVRPVSRALLMLAKYFAALSCLFLAAVLALGLGLVVDLAKGLPSFSLLTQLLQPLALAMAAMAIASAVGLLFGVLFNSVAASAILSVYLGNQLSALAILPGLFFSERTALLLAVSGGILLPALILSVAIGIFRKKVL
ncbi:MAG: ABC transporter permease [Spirochaetes bacterium]|nr:ABC transporter permease [Spirochaetota bacterium]MBU0956844.1 ABC transporter permease [Spirochaetota bacterium]